MRSKRRLKERKSAHKMLGLTVSLKSIIRFMPLRWSSACSSRVLTKAWPVWRSLSLRSNRNCVLLCKQGRYYLKTKCLFPLTPSSDHISNWWPILSSRCTSMMVNTAPVVPRVPREVMPLSLRMVMWCRWYRKSFLTYRVNAVSKSSDI